MYIIYDIHIYTCTSALESMLMSVGEPLQEAAVRWALVKLCNPFLSCSDTLNAHPVLLLAFLNFIPSFHIFSCLVHFLI